MTHFRRRDPVVIYFGISSNYRFCFYLGIFIKKIDEIIG